MSMKESDTVGQWVPSPPVKMNYCQHAGAQQTRLHLEIKTLFCLVKNN